MKENLSTWKHVNQIYQNLLNLNNLIIILIRYSQNVNAGFKTSLVYCNAY